MLYLKIKKKIPVDLLELPKFIPQRPLHLHFTSPKGLEFLSILGLLHMVLSMVPLFPFTTVHSNLFFRSQFRIL